MTDVKKNGDDVKNNSSPARANGRRRSRSPRDRRGNDRSDPQDRRVYVSNIPYECKWMNLKDIFKEKVGEVAFVELYDDEKGKPKGCGIVEFKLKEDAKKAVEILHQYEISGRKIMVREERETDRRRLEREAIPQSKGGKRKIEDRDGRDATPMMGAGGMSNNGIIGGGGGGGGGNNQWQGLISAVPPKILQSIGVDPQGPLSATLFVSNLDYKVKWKHLFDAFSLAGKVVTGEMKLDDDGKSRGMAVVQMDNPLEAIQAISMLGNQLLFDRKINVRMDRYDGNEPKKGEAERRAKGGIPDGLKNIGMGLGAGGTVVNIGRLLEEQRQQQSMMSSMSNMSPMGGMGSSMGGMSGMSMMNGSMGGMSGMSSMSGMGMGGSSLSSGFGGGSFGSGGGGMSGLSDRGMGEMRGLSAERMGRDNLGMPSLGGSMGGGGLSSDFRGSSSLGGLSSLSGMRDFPSSLGDMRSSGMSSGLGVLGSGAGGAGILDSFNPPGPSMMGGSTGGRGGGRSDPNKDPESSIFVRNLPFSLNWQDLKDKFRCVGDVRYAEIKQKDGKSMGCGVVRFGSKDEAQKAIELFDRTRVDGREIEVRLDRA